ncbi:hypothetical protein D3C72_902830 [compost metagenome]
MAAYQRCPQLQRSQRQLGKTFHAVITHHKYATQPRTYRYYLVKAQQIDATVAGTGDVFQVAGAFVQRGDVLLPALLLQALQRFAQPLRFRRFQQVIKRMLFKGLHRVFVIGGQEHDMRHAIRVEHAYHLQPGNARHLNIQKHHVRLQAMDPADGFYRIGAFADNADALFRFQQMSQVIARRRFIIDNQYV